MSSPDTAAGLFRFPKWQPKQRLPGAINVGLFDGHAEQVQLERL